MQGDFYQHGSMTHFSHHPQQVFDILNYYKHPSLMQRQRRSWKNKPAPKAPVSPPRPHSDHFLFAQDNLGQVSYSIVFPQSKDPLRVKLCDIKASPSSGIPSSDTPDPLVTTSKIPLNVSTESNRIENSNSHGHGDGNNIKEQDEVGGVDIGTPPKINSSNNKSFDVYHQRINKQQEHHNRYQQGDRRLNSTQVATFPVTPYRTQSNGHRRFPPAENHDYNYAQLQQHYHYPPLPYHNYPYYYQQQQQQQQQYWKQQYPIVLYDYQYQYMDNEDEKHHRRILTNTTTNSTRSSFSALTPRRFSSGSSGSSCKSTLGSSMESTFTDNNDSPLAPANSESTTQVVAISSEEYRMDDLPQHYNEDHTADASSSCNANTQTNIVLGNNDNGLSASVLVSCPDTCIIKADTATINNNINSTTEIKENDSNSDNTTTTTTTTSDPTTNHLSPPSTSSSVDSFTPPSSATSVSPPDSTTNMLPIWADPIKVRENPTRYKVIQDYMAEHKLSYTSPLPLNQNVVFYFGGDTSKSKTTVANYRSSIQPIFTCQTVWEFSSRWRHCKEQLPGYKPSHMAINQNLYCFQQGVEPMWEDKVNKHGGRLTLTLDTTTPRTDLLLDNLFDWVLCAFVGGNLVKYGMVGLVLSKRARADRIELWLDQYSTNPDTLTSLKNSLLSFVPSKFHEPVLSSTYKKHYN